MDNIIYDITYIGIGSAVIRDTTPENRQQFPPFIENIYNNTDCTIHVINIDPNFENPYFLTQYFSDLEKLSDTIFTKNRLKITYISDYVDIVDNIVSFNWFETLNNIIMDNNKLLICGNYTGYSCNIIENKFKKHYENTIYEDKFNKYIIYDFLNININSCMCNLLENFPIINLKNFTIVKINNIDLNNFMEIYEKTIEIDNSYKNKIEEFIINKFYEFINYNHYVYRNLKNDNYNENIINSIQFSIFKGESKEFLTEKFKLKLIEYYQIIEFLFNDKFIELEHYIYNMENYNDYEWRSIVTKIIKK
jgi:hypothetical protein